MKFGYEYSYEKEEMIVLSNNGKEILLGLGNIFAGVAKEVLLNKVCMNKNDLDLAKFQQETDFATLQLQHEKDLAEMNHNLEMEKLRSAYNLRFGKSYDEDID